MKYFDNISEISVFYKNEKFFPSILKRQCTETDVISYTGGALGLFLGFSVISLIEIVYYFTIRIFFERRRLKRIGVIRKQLFKKTSKNMLTNYLMESSIHGMSQTVFKRRHIIERVFWSVILIASLIYCGLSTLQMYESYINAPIVMTYNDKSVRAEDVSCTT
jgi:Amiloride-sensitive sodium channel